MENATKALLIAAAILIAIVLISIGVFVLRQGQDAINSVNMSESEILAFNSKFTAYDGTQRGSSINALLDTIAIANRDLVENGGTAVTIDGNSGAALATDGKTVTTKVSTNGYFEVKTTSVAANIDGNGLIKNITINKK